MRTCTAELIHRLELDADDRCCLLRYTILLLRKTRHLRAHVHNPPAGRTSSTFCSLRAPHESPKRTLDAARSEPLV